MRSIIVVTGLPRSGTSLIMRMYDAMEHFPIYTDKVRKWDSSNPKGYYEHENVKRLSKGDASWIGEAEGHVIKVVYPLFEVFMRALRGSDIDNILVIQMHRNAVDIAESMHKMSAYQYRSSGELLATVHRWQQMYEQVHGWTGGNDRCVALNVRFEELFMAKKNHYQIDRLLNYTYQYSGIGGSLEDWTLAMQQCIATIEPTLWRNQSGYRETTGT